MRDKSYYDVYELKNRFMNMLSYLGFKSASSVCEKSTDIIYETYEFPYEDNEQIKILNRKIDEYLIKVNAPKIYLSENQNTSRRYYRPFDWGDVRER